MKKKLPARSFWCSALLLLLALFGHPALASHLLGGEMTYRFIDDSGPANVPLRYEVTMSLYQNCNNINTVPYADVAIYDQATGAKLTLTAANYAGTIVNGNARLPQTFFSTCQTQAIPPGCTAPSVTQTYQVQRLNALINLPGTTRGYYALWSEGNRNNDITNLLNPSGLYMSLYATLSPPAIFNRSPVFSTGAISIICASDTVYYLNSAVDADGDRLEYSFGQPYSVTTPLPTTFNGSPSLASYATVAGSGTFAPTTPFGTGRGIVNHLNTSTGLATFATFKTGKYVIAIDVKEYRVINGVEKLIGITRRDVQLVVGVCSAVFPAPQLPPPVSIPGYPTFLPRTYTIEAGTSQTIPLTATQRGQTQNPLAVTVTSELLDGPGGYNATLNGNPGTLNGLAGSASATGNGSVTANFVYNASCTDARTQPYDLAVTIQDNGCGGKTVYDLFRITVVKPQGPTAIAGDAAVCGTTGTSTYTASGGTTAGVTWTVTGGTIVGSATANPVQVQWTTAGAGTISVKGVSAAGCITDEVVKTVAVSAVPTLTITGNRTICPGTSTSITVSGGSTGAVYTVTGGPVAGTSPTFVLTPTATTTYTVTAPNANGCPITGTVTITVNPAVTANAGPAVSTISNQPVAIGAAPVAGYTYSWSPVLGLNDPTSANPTVRLPNPTSAPITQTYTLTATNTATGCTGTATVLVTVGIEPNVEVPNVITPNGDKLNDWLQVKNVNSHPINSMEIFNRWGRRVYSTTNYNNTTNYWGTDPGIMPGMYYYLFKQPDGAVTRGWVEVIK